MPVLIRIILVVQAPHKSSIKTGVKQWEIKFWIVLMIRTGRAMCVDGDCVGDFRHTANIYLLGPGQRCASSLHKNSWAVEAVQ